MGPAGGTHRRLQPPSDSDGVRNRRAASFSASVPRVDREPRDHPSLFKAPLGRPHAPLNPSLETRAAAVLAEARSAADKLLFAVVNSRRYARHRVRRVEPRPPVPSARLAVPCSAAAASSPRPAMAPPPASAPAPARGPPWTAAQRPRAAGPRGPGPRSRRRHSRRRGPPWTAARAPVHRTVPWTGQPARPCRFAKRPLPFFEINPQSSPFKSI